MKNFLLKLVFCFAVMLTAKTSMSQTTQPREDYPFTRISLQKDTLFVLDCPVGLCIIDIWRKDTKKKEAPVLIFTKDIDFIQNKKFKCEKIVETFKLN